MKSIVLSLTMLSLMALACKQSKEKQFENYAILGDAEILCDSSLRKIIEQEEDVFEYHYNYAKVNIRYTSEQEAIKAFYKDSLKAMIVCTSIDSNDIKKFNANKVYPRQYKFATSAIAFVTSKENSIDSLKYEQIKNWMADPKSRQYFIIEDKYSGIARDILRKVGLSQFNQNVFAKESKQAIIDWLVAHPNDIGLVDWSDLSDSDDAQAKETLGKVKLLAISNQTGDSRYYYPFQYNLNGLYPFTRDLYITRRNAATDVSLGFASFICGEIGQKIILKAGLLPNYQTERWIEFKGLTDIKVIK